MNPKTKYDRAYESLKFLEYNNAEDKFLHRNIGEKSYTLGGIYQHIYKDNEIVDWDFVDAVLKVCKQDYRRASTILFHDIRTEQQVYNFFRKEYWDFNRLDEIQSNEICTRLFLTAVVFGSRTAVKIAQRVVGVTQDGIVGPRTIKNLNMYDLQMFEKQFVYYSKEHINTIIERNPKLAINRSGWINRINYEVEA